MKKILAFVLVMAMVFSFAACGKAKAAQVKIYGLDGNAAYDFSVEPKDGITAGELLEKYFSENGIPYEKLDADMIQSVGDLEQDCENWSVYFEISINGEYATEGLWGFELKDGDLLEIKLVENNF